MKQQQREMEKAICGLMTDLKSCGMRRDSQWGRRIHARAVESQENWNTHVARALIRMYAKCGSMRHARDVLERTPEAGCCWNALILGYAENGDGHAALEVFSSMKARGRMPTSATYVAALKACTSLLVNGRKDDILKRGREIHAEIGCHMNRCVQSTLIEMYAKCGNMPDGQCVFDSIQSPDVVCWTALLLGYAENGDGFAGLEVFSQMKERGCHPDSVTYIAALKACASLAASGAKEVCLARGREIHSEIGSHLKHNVKNLLIDMYGKSGSMADAHCVFDSIERPDVVSWTALLMGYAENGEGSAALELFTKMKACGCTPNYVTFVAVLKACTSCSGIGKEDCLRRARGIHLQIGRHCDSSYVKCTLIDVYAKLSSMEEARRVFESIQEPDVASWNALLLGYAENGDALATLDWFLRMKACVCVPNSTTYVAVLKACGLLGSLSLGRKFHLEISDFTAQTVTCLVDFYAKCGSMVEARQVFDRHPRTSDISTWNALLAGYCCTDSGSGFELFEAMQEQRLHPDGYTFVSVLLCCSHAGLVQKAREYLGTMAAHYGVAPELIHYNCMVDILGRGNQLNEAFAVARVMPCSSDAITWRVLLGACRRWKNLKLGRLVFQSLVDMDTTDSAPYVLMAHIYGTRRMWVEQENTLGKRLNEINPNHV